MNKPLKEDQETNLLNIVVKALADIKALDIQAFDTTSVTPLFDSVVIASGQSSRQVKALARNVYDKVMQAGLDKPLLEGEENAEWIIIDCGSVVVHVMQPFIRDYYRLEDLWNETPLAIS